MKKTFEFVSSKTGKTIRFEGEYTCTMKMRYADPDHNVEMGLEESTWSWMTVYVDGKEYSKSWNPWGWRLVETETGSLAASGLKIAFTDRAIAEQYEAFIADLIEQGTSEEVKTHRAEKAEAEKAAAIASAEATVKAVKAPEKLPTAEQAKKWLDSYNKVVNEGGEGVLPITVTAEQYAEAVRTLETLNPTGYSVSISYWVDGSGWSHGETFESGVCFQTAREYIEGCLSNGVDFQPEPGEDLFFEVHNADGNEKTLSRALVYKIRRLPRAGAGNNPAEAARAPPGKDLPGQVGSNIPG